MTQYYVATNGNDSANGSSGSPWATLTHAGTQVSSGDTVNVLPGTYNQNVYLNVSGTSGSPITFKSTVQWGAKLLASTSANFCFQSQGDWMVIQDFDISTGVPTLTYSGLVFNGSNNVIRGCYVHDIPSPNSDGNGGTGIDSANHSAVNSTIFGCVVGNIGSTQQTDGNGIYFAMNGGNCYNNIAYNCYSNGFQLWHAGQHINFYNNLSFNNAKAGILIGTGDAYSGGSSGDYCVVANNICYGNNSGIREENLPTTATHNVFYNNCLYANSVSTDQYYNASGQWQGTITGTVSSNPLFVSYNSDGNQGPWGGGTANYQIQSGSPCIGAGNSTYEPATDFLGVTRPSGGPYDIGPYQYVQNSNIFRRQLQNLSYRTLQSTTFFRLLEPPVVGFGSNKLTYGLAPPAYGSWSVGDICFNTATEQTSSTGWICTTAGNPGTWTASSGL